MRMYRLRTGTSKEIKQYINQGYSPVGTLKFILNEHLNLLERYQLTIYTDDKMKIIDIQEEYIKDPFPKLINLIKRIK